MRFFKKKRKIHGARIEIDFDNRDRMAFENHPSMVLSDTKLTIHNDLGGISWDTDRIIHITIKDHKGYYIGDIYPNLHKDENKIEEDNTNGED